jgi:hypothetical protein
VEHQHCLLIDALHRDEPHRWPGDRLAYRLRVGYVSLAALHIRLHISWRHQAHVVAKGKKLAAPMMGRFACFHPDQAWRQRGEELQDLSAPKLSPDQHFAIGIDSVELKYVLRQINTDGHYFLLHGSSPRRGSTTTSLHSYARAGVVHPITSFAISRIDRWSR